MKRSKKCYAAIDLGAESGRVVAGTFDGARLDLQIVHRFPNRPARLPDGLHWDVLSLLSETVDGLRMAGRVDGAGIDAWGCDYGLLDAEGRLLGNPFHYRDSRTASVVGHVFARVSKDELYGRTGIQHLRFNTIFQLHADWENATTLNQVERIALIPDLLAFWLTGTLVNEATIASTSGIADASTRGWALDLVERLGLPAAPFRHELVEPGTSIGEIAPFHGFEPGTVVRAVAGHDTASAFAGTPIASSNAAVISSGTWSLVGLELDQPRLGIDAAEANLSNEWGIDGTTRLLRNVMGLWLLQECRRQWERQGTDFDYDDLQLLAAVETDEVAVFDPDLDIFLEPGDMPARIEAVCRHTEQRPPKSQAEIARSILLSLACKCKVAVSDLERVSGRGIEVVHLVGGGSRNELLCRLTADVLGVPVHAGPVEATAFGNILVQLRAADQLASREEMLACVQESYAPIVYEPAGRSSVYEKYLAVTGTAERVGAEELSR